MRMNADLVARLRKSGAALLPTTISGRAARCQPIIAPHSSNRHDLHRQQGRHQPQSRGTEPVGRHRRGRAHTRTTGDQILIFLACNDAGSEVIPKSRVRRNQKNLPRRTRRHGEDKEWNHGCTPIHTDHSKQKRLDLLFLSVSICVHPWFQHLLFSVFPYLRGKKFLPGKQEIMGCQLRSGFQRALDPALRGTSEPASLTGINMKVSIRDLNQLDQPSFVRGVRRVLLNILHGSPSRLGWTGSFRSVEHLHQAMCNIVAASTQEKQLALIRAHPDLVGRLAREGRLTASSTAEQAAAGLTQLTALEAEAFNRYNAQYQSRFGFPFVICARQNKKEAILAAFPVRLQNRPRRGNHQCAE